MDLSGYRFRDCAWVVLLLCGFAVFPRHIAADGPVGKGDWIDYPSVAIDHINAIGAGSLNSIADLATFIKTKDGCSWVAVKCAGGDLASSEFNSQLVSTFHAAHLQIYGWHRVTGMSSAITQGQLARQIMQNISPDGLIIVPSAGVAASSVMFYDRGVTRAKDYWKALNNITSATGPTIWDVGYSGWAKAGRYTADGVAVDQYFRNRATFDVPRFFWGKSTPGNFTPEANAVHTNWINTTNIPMSIMGQCQATVSNPGMVTNFWNDIKAQQATHPLITSYSLWVLDSFSNQDFTEWQAVPSSF